MPDVIEKSPLPPGSMLEIGLELIDEGFSMSHADVALALDDLSAEYKLAWRLERFGE